MKVAAVFAAAALAAVGTSAPASAAPAAWPPLELEIRTPFPPTAFPSAGRTYLTYELHLRNFTTKPQTLRRIEVLAADAPTGDPVWAVEGAELDALLHKVGERIVGDQVPKAGSGYGREIAPGGSVLVFLSIALEPGAQVPAQLRHRVYTADSVAEGAAIDTHHTALRVFGPPVTGPGWVADSGPSNDSHHRRGVIVWTGETSISRRYAIDWVQMDGGAMFKGDPTDNGAYLAYGEDVLAVGAGRVVEVVGDVAENTPRSPPPAPVTYRTLGGNWIVLDLGQGRFAHYMHLQADSVRVKPGERVRRGQVIAKLGNSGDARAPHLHFEITTSAAPLTGEGVPYLIDRFRVRTPDGVWETRVRELPLKGMQIEFER